MTRQTFTFFNLQNKRLSIILDPMSKMGLGVTTSLILFLLVALGILAFWSNQPQETRSQAEGSSLVSACDNNLQDACGFIEFRDIVESNLTPQELLARHQEPGLPTEEKARLMTAILFSIRRSGTSSQSASAHTDDVVKTALESYVYLRRNFPLYMQEYSEWFWRTYEYLDWQLWDLVNQNSASNPNLFSLIYDDPRYQDVKDILLNSFNSNIAYVGSNHTNQYTYLQNLDQNIIRNKQIATLSRLYQPHLLDTDQTAKMKAAVLNKLIVHIQSPANTSLSGCQLFDRFLSRYGSFNTLIISDLDPQRAGDIKSRFDQIQLSCLVNNYDQQLSQIIRTWRGYLDFLNNHQSLFTSSPDTNQVLNHFGIGRQTIESSTVYGNFNSPINSIDQYYAVIALETHAKLSSYTFPPNRGYQLLDQERRSGNLPVDYVVYARPPTTVGWVANQEDYNLEQSGRGNIINYQLAHATYLNNELLSSRYNLPLLRLKPRIFYITNRDFLENLRLSPSAPLTRFEDYALPDISTASHFWKVQTIGPIVPGSRPGVLSGDDNWRAECLPDPQAPRYEFFYQGIKYCLDVGGLHERGHLIHHMMDLHYSVNTNDLFWNYNPESAEGIRMCQAFQNLRNTAPQVLTTKLYDLSLSNFSVADRYTPIDWEHNYFETVSPNLIDWRFHNQSRLVVIAFNSPESQRRIKSIKWQVMADTGVVSDVAEITPAQPQNTVSLAMSVRQLFKNGTDFFLVSVTLDGESAPESIIFPRKLLEHSLLLHGRTGNFTPQYHLTLSVLPQNRPPSNLGEVRCDSPQAVYNSQHIFHPNNMGITTGIQSDRQTVVTTLQPYFLLSMPLNVWYAFSYKAENQPLPVFPASWSGAMPSLSTNPTPTQPYSTVTPTATVTLVPTQPSTVTPTPTRLPTALPSPINTPRPTWTTTPNPTPTNLPAPTVTPTPTPQSCQASPDINGSGTVDLFDISILISALMTEGEDLPADLNCDQVVNLADFSILITNLNL